MREQMGGTPLGGTPLGGTPLGGIPQILPKHGYFSPIAK